jgi:hypothetical protein
MTPEQLNKEVTERRLEIAALSDLWEVVVGNHVPSQQQFNIWTELHSFEILVRSIRETGTKQAKRRGTMCADHLVRFCSQVANQKSALERTAAA